MTTTSEPLVSPINVLPTTAAIRRALEMLLFPEEERLNDAVRKAS